MTGSFTVERNELLNPLNMVKGIVERKTTIPVLSNLLLEITATRLHVTATDLDVSVQTGCPIKETVPGITTLPAHRLHEIVRLLPADAEIQFKLEDNDTVTISSGRSHYKLIGIPSESFPTIPKPGGDPMTISGRVIQTMLPRVQFAISQEDSRYTLSGALLLIRPLQSMPTSEITLVATDGHRLAITTDLSPTGIETEIRTIVSRKALAELVRIPGDLRFSANENHLRFSAEDQALTARVMAGQFPNYDLVIPKDPPLTVTVETAALATSIKRAAVMSNSVVRQVRFVFSADRALLTASDSDSGESKETIQIESNIPNELQMAFNPTYLLDFMSVVATERIQIGLTDHESPALFRPVGGPETFSYRYVVMPMKV